MGPVSLADAAHAIVDPVAGIAREVPPRSRMSQRGTATIQKAICQLMEGDTARVTYRRLWLKIEFGVPNAGTCAHHLNVAGNNTSGVPQAVAMGHCTFADISNDFRVRLSMWGKPLFGAISSSFQKRSGPHPEFASAGEKWCLAWSQLHRSPESERKGRRSITAFSEDSAV
jgi:hypothetical protein